MGAWSANFHLDVFDRMGYTDVVHEIQDHFLARRKWEAIAAVPLELVDDIALIGPTERIRDGLDRWKKTVVTNLLVQANPFAPDPIAELRTLAEVLF